MENQNRVGLADLYHQFRSLRAVARFLCASESTVRRRLLESGVQLNPKGLEQRRGRLVSRVLDGLAARLKAAKWRDERKLLRALDGPFATLFVLLVQRTKSGDISPREAATRWAQEISEAYKATGPSPDPLLINLDNLEAAFTRAASRCDRIAALYWQRHWRP